MINLSARFDTQQASDVPRECHLKDPYTGEFYFDDKGEPVTISVMGFQSTVARNKLNEQNRHKTQAKPSDQLGAEFLATLTTGWSDSMSLDGNKKLPFSFDNAVSIYLKYDGLARQVSDFASNIANFEPKK